MAAGDSASPDATAALEKLCRTYWHPLYAYVRRCGHSVHDAQDLTQEFLAGLLQRKGLAGLRPEKGRFRAFLLASLKHFLADQRDRERAQKRGGGVPVLSLDDLTAEARYQLEPRDELTPDRAFERRWAYTLLEQVLVLLRGEFVLADKGPLFEALRPFLVGEAQGVSYSEVAARLGLTEAAAKMTVTRMRRRYRELLRAEVAHTVADPREIDEELRQLMVALQ